MREVDALYCGRENDLVAFLYGELSDSEKQSFENHLQACRLCQVQTSEFRSIRESVAAWRDESLGRAAVAVPATVSLINQRKVSALAAFRAFFDLSPLWMKGAVGFAAVLFCIFSGLALVHLRTAPAITTQAANTQAYSQQQFNALVEQRVQNELARQKSAEQPTPAPIQDSVATKDKNLRVRSRSLNVENNEVAVNSRNQRARRPLSKAEREQLAADLRLVSSRNERGLDPADDQINQQ
ncbi:MAG: zf-HC2 domain-containing protein [bacterium]